MIKEIERKYASGYLAVGLLPLLLISDIWVFVTALQTQSIVMGVFSILTAIVLLVCVAGFFMVHPNQARVLTLFGTYVGSARETGLRWANPFYAKQAVSLRIRNFDCDSLKVNDSSGNPIELDDERKAAMVSNLLVVLCGEENAQPVLNTGSLYN